MTVRGQVIADRYQLDREIGKGAMGSVWLSKHLTLGTPVAIKLISGEAARDPDSLARFAREAQLAARIRSRHVVQVLDHGHHDDLPYIVMEYLEGQSLRARLDAAGHLDKAETTTIVRHVARALAHAHGLGLVHRDIKPENVFVTAGEEQDEQVYKVLDFGVAKVTDELARTGVDPTRTGAMLGTPYYLSPEQAAGLKTLDFRSDLWALAVLAFECLSGKLPFSARALGPLIAQITLAPIPVLSQHAAGAGITPQMDAWMARGLCREPDGRFGSAKEMAEALAATTGVSESRPPDHNSAVMPAPFLPTPSSMGQDRPGPDGSELGDSANQGLGESANQQDEVDDLAKTAMIQEGSELNSTMAFPEGYPGQGPPADLTQSENTAQAPMDPSFAPLPVPAFPEAPAGDGAPPAEPAVVEATPGKPRSIDSLIRAPWPEPIPEPPKASAAPLIIAVVAVLLLLGGGAVYYFFGMSGDELAETESGESDEEPSAPDDTAKADDTATASSAPPPDPSASATDTASSAAPADTTAAPPATEPPPKPTTTTSPPPKPTTTSKPPPKPTTTTKPQPTGTWSHRKTL